MCVCEWDGGGGWTGRIERAYHHVFMYFILFMFEFILNCKK